MNNPFDYVPDEDCISAFRKLSAYIESLRESSREEDSGFLRELDDGKMLGVLIAVDNAGNKHTLFAFSGQLGNGGFHHDRFVGPVFDYLLPHGYFKTKECEISRQNHEISKFENSCLSIVREEYETAKNKAESTISRFKEQCRLSKQSRDSRRASGSLSESEALSLIRQSQFEKAELHRLKKKMASDLAPLLARLESCKTQLDAMKRRRKAYSESLQEWLFTNFRLLNARGESQSLKEIFAKTDIKTPPSGAGECCAPKLLQAAYLRGWIPLSIAEFWYGRPKSGEVRLHGHHYPACRGKCLPILRWMLEGLAVTPPLGNEFTIERISQPRIIYENEYFCVIDKPTGMLSVRGKEDDLSLQQWLEERFGVECEVKVAHRLDQDTSGLIMATFGQTAFKTMQKLFATRAVTKTYVADLEGYYRQNGLSESGRIELPLAPDILDRPRQRIDFENGKPAVTEYEFLKVTDGRSRVSFHPHTGRTHQLRVHSASNEGLGMPIVGDRLYGKRADRLHLHAHRIAFTFPLDGRDYSFESPVPFS